MSRNVKIWLTTLISPFVVILLIALALYMPPVQNWAVGIASKSASEATGMDISVGYVRLAFPLNLSLEEVKVLKQDSILPQRKDTIAYINRAIASIQVTPLLQEHLRINVLEIAGIKIHTADFIPQARVCGSIGRIAVIGDNPIASVILPESFAIVKRFTMDDAHLDVALNDSVPEDTTTSENVWRIHLQELKITNSDLLLHTSGDTLRIGTQLKDLTLNDGVIDLKRGLYQVGRIVAKNNSVQYDNSAEPYSTTKKLDFNHLFIDNINAQIDSISYNTTNTSLSIKKLSFKERSGFVISAANADVAMDSTLIKLGCNIKTASSHIAIQLDMNLNSFNSTPNKQKGTTKARIYASVSKQDIDLLLNAIGMDEYSNLLPNYPISITGIAEGNYEELHIPTFSINLPTAFTVNANGKANGFMSLANNIYSPAFSASLHTDIRTQNVNPIISRFTPTIKVPAMHAVGDLNIKGADYLFSLNATEGRGQIAAKGEINLGNMFYKASVYSRSLNIGHFYAGAGIGTFTGNAKIEGQGTDVLSTRTWIKSEAQIDRLNYDKYNLNNIKANLTLKGGRAYASLNAHNELIDGKIDIDALVNTKRLDATFMTELAYADLCKLKLVDKPLKVSVCTHLDVMSDFKNTHTLQGTCGDITITDSAKTYRPDDITVDCHTDMDTTIAKVYCGDFIFRLNSQNNYKKLLNASDKLNKEIKKQFAERTIDQTMLREALPRLSVSLHSSKENPIYRFIKYYEVDYDEVDATITTSREDGINANLLVKGFASSGYKLDTVALNINSTNTPYAIVYSGYVHNVAPNDYIFKVDYNGEVLEHGISLNNSFYDENNELGLKLGFDATMVEDGIKLHLTPDNPVIGYESFKLKDDNYILLGHNNRVFADVDMISKGGTGITLYSTSNEENTDALQDITLSITKLDIKRLLSAIPYAPNVSGLLDGDVHFIQDNDESFSISSSLNTHDLIYENCPIGNLGTDIVYMPKENDEHYVDGVMTLDGNEIGTVKGTYNFNTSNTNADITLEKFPLSMINGFIPERIIGLEGYTEGVLTIRGNTSNPNVNGELYVESASLISIPYGIKMRFDDDPIRIVDSKLLFENFQMYANNNKPLTSYGELDFSDTNHLRLNLLMRAENFLLIDSKETGRSEAYGKAYVNFLASIKGEIDRLQVRGKLDVLPTTNIFYILRDSPLSNDNRMKELVQFTDLHSDDSIEIQRPQVEGLNVNFNVNVMNGSHVKCWLNDARSNYLDIIGEGTLQMKYANDEMTLTGRYTINEGEIKYSLPVIPLKTFVISNGSYIEFSGDMMNPKLNITAKETKKASVNINGAERMVTFNTGIVLSKTLNDMGLEFIIEAPEDNTVSDELNMKSKEERGKLAVTMLTTGMYLSDGNTSSFSMNSALNSFLQSEINSIAGSALKTLDVSFGMDNSTEEDGTMHTNYSFKFAKRFWNNRLSISVGGKLSTGPDVSGQNKSFFDNVEVQYRMSDISNKYLNLFYNRSVYDFLEGYVGQYGGGFLWKKKVNSLKEIFKPSAQELQFNPKTTKKENLNTQKDSIKGGTK